VSTDDLSAFAHELKTPLAVITGFAELLASRDDEQTRKEATERIFDAASRLSATVDELLATLVENDGLAQSFLAAQAGRSLPR
jgi:signal transduction histidine kinase